MSAPVHRRADPAGFVADALPVIAFDQNPWSGTWMNRQELLSRLALRNWKVLYSTGATSIWERGSWRSNNFPLFGRFETMDGVIVDRPGRMVPAWPRWPAWDAFAMNHHSQRLRQAVGKGNDGKFIALAFNPTYQPYIENLNPRYTVFHVRDYYPGLPNWTKSDQRRLEALVERADLVTLAGSQMAETLPQHARHRARLLPNGVDAQAYIEGAAQPCPDDLSTIPGPRLGYIGSINPKLDLPTVLAISVFRPDWHWVFVGPYVAPNFSGGREHDRLWKACLDRPNIHWLGLKDHRSLPAYTANMDVNTMIYRLDGPASEWSRFTNPLKLHGYMAAGKPVIGADLPAIQPYREVIDISRSPTEWIAAIELALHHGGIGTPEARRRVALENTWDCRVDQLEEWLLEMIADGEVTMARQRIPSSQSKEFEAAWDR